jgi:hypothetical protein
MLRCDRFYDESQHVYHAHFPVHPDHGERVTEAPGNVSTAIEYALFRDPHNKEFLKIPPCSDSYLARPFRCR